jgi:bla regulator protein blaR1
MQAFLEMVLSNAVMATLLALVAAAVTWFGRRPALSHVLWLIVLLKLVTPPVVAVPLWSDSFAAWMPEPITTMAEADTPELSTTSPPDEDTTMQEEPSPQEEEAAACTREPVVLSEPLTSARPPDSVVPPFSWPGFACALWLGGCVFWLILCGSRIYAFQCLLAYGQPAPDALQQEAEAIAEQLGLLRCPEVWLVPARISPLLWGFATRVRLVLPSRLLDELKPEQRATLLAHELAHARRHDHWVRWLELAVTGLYWWHPVVWWARHQLQHAEEQCCDSWVVWLLPRAAKAYARTLLQTVDFLDARIALPPVASGAGHLHQLKRRLHMITREPCSPRLSWPVLLAAVAVGAVALSLTPQWLKAQDPADEPASVAVNDDEPQSPALDDEDEQESGRSERRSGDLEQRMRRLEERLDRLLRTLPQGGDRGMRDGEQGGRENAERRARDEERRARDEARRAREAGQREAERARRNVEVEVRRQKERAEQAVRQAKEHAERAARQAKEQAREHAEHAVREAKEHAEHTAHGAKERGKQESKSSAKEEKRQIRARIVIDGKEINPQMLQEQIQRSIHEAINPERMHDLQKQIDEAVHQSLNPERMKDLDKRIEEMVNRTVNPQRLEALGRQIEQAVNQSLNAQQREQARNAERGQQRQRAGSGSSRGSSSSSSSRSSSNDSDLERRMNRLEEKMERVLQALESRKEKK